MNLGGVKSRDGNLVDLSPRLVCYRSDESRATLSAQQGSTEYPVSVNTASVEPFNPILGAQYFALGEVEHAEGKKNGHPCFIYFSRALLSTQALLRLVPVSKQAEGPSIRRYFDSASALGGPDGTHLQQKHKQEGKGAVRDASVLSGHCPSLCLLQVDVRLLFRHQLQASGRHRLNTGHICSFSVLTSTKEPPALTGCSCLAGAGVAVRARVLNCVDGVNVALLQKAVTEQRSFFRERQSEGHRATEDV